MMLRGANGREVVRAVEARVDEINAGGVLPRGLKIVPYYKRSEIIGRAVYTVNEALIIGSLFVVFVLYLFLRSFRGAFIVMLALPLSVLFTFILMRLVGLSANLMSLGGLAISIGMIIDATIIQVENVQRHLSEKGAGRPSWPRSFGPSSKSESRRIFGELIIALTFIPIIALQGIEGKMFLPLAFTHVIALMASLLLSLFAIPAFCYIFLKAQPDKTESSSSRAAKRAYLPLLKLGAGPQGGLSSSRSHPAGRDAGSSCRGSAPNSCLIMDEGAFDTDVAIPARDLAAPNLSR